MSHTNAVVGDAIALGSFQSENAQEMLMVEESEEDSDDEQLDLALLRRRCGPDCIVKRLWDDVCDKDDMKFACLQDDNPPIEDNLQSHEESIYKELLPMQIRVLKILPGRPTSPLQCQLLRATLVTAEGVRLDEPPHAQDLVSYDALSYSWGQCLPSTSLICNGIRHPLTQHLKSALLHLRHDSDARFLFVDAFCIDQDNNAEKGQQIQMMYDIFQKAQKVIAWMGVPKNDMRRSLNLLHMSNHGPGRISEREIRFHLHKARYSSALDTRCCRIITKLEQKIVKLVLSNAWFRRTWVRQEVFAARNIVLMCGKYTVRWELFLDIVKDEQSIGQHPVQELWRWPCGGSSGPSQWLDAVLTNSRGFEASVPQDRIFALQNLVSGNKLFPEIDYRIDCGTVYEEFVKRLIAETRSLEILGVFENRRRTKSSKLASWAPDWRTTQTRVLVRENWRFNLGKRKSQFVDIGGPGELRILGWHFATIATVSPHNSAPNEAFKQEARSFFVSRLTVPRKPKPIHTSSAGMTLFPVEESFRPQSFIPQPSAIQVPARTKFTDIGYELFPFKWDQCFERKDPRLIYNGIHGDMLLIASQEAQPGDLVIRARFGLIHLNERDEKLTAKLYSADAPAQCYCTYVVREIDAARRRYRFLGPCIFLKSLHKPPHFLEPEDIQELAGSSEKFRRWPPRSARDLMKLLDTWELDHRQEFILQ